jgi:hypothetical protein
VHRRVAGVLFCPELAWAQAARDARKEGSIIAKVDLVVKYKIPIPVLGKLAEALVLKQNGWEANPAVANSKARLEASPDR